MTVIDQKRTQGGEMTGLNELEALEAQQLLIQAAQQLASGQVSFIDGVRRVAASRWSVSRLEHDPDFSVFVAVESESDHLPSTELRQHCAVAWLEESDRQAKQLESAWGDQVRAACGVLVARFSG
jgi:hypothetical protein